MEALFDWCKCGRSWYAKVGRSEDLCLKVSVRGNKQDGYTYYVDEIFGVGCFGHRDDAYDHKDLNSAKVCAERIALRLAEEVMTWFQSVLKHVPEYLASAVAEVQKKHQQKKGK